MARNTKGIEIAEIIPDQCIGCQACAGACPVGAIEIVDGVAHIDPEACIGCGKCAGVCPVEAIRYEQKKGKAATEEEKEARAGDGGYRGVAVFVEVLEGHGATVSWELVGKGRELAGRLKAPTIGFVVAALVTIPVNVPGVGLSAKSSTVVWLATRVACLVCGS